MMAAVAAATTLGAVELDVSFVKGLLAIPSESRLIPECTRAVVYVKDYLGNGGLDRPFSVELDDGCVLPVNVERISGERDYTARLEVNVN